MRDCVCTVEQQASITHLHTHTHTHTGDEQVAAVEKDALLKLQQQMPAAAQQLETALSLLGATSATRCADASPTDIQETALDPPIETMPRFLMGTADDCREGEEPSALRSGRHVTKGANEGQGVRVRMYSRGAHKHGNNARAKVATGYAARQALSCSPRGVSGALLHARSAILTPQYKASPPQILLLPQSSH